MIAKSVLFKCAAYLLAKSKVCSKCVDVYNVCVCLSSKLFSIQKAFAYKSSPIENKGGKGEI